MDMISGDARLGRPTPWHLSATLVLILGAATALAANAFDGVTRDVLVGLIGTAAFLVGAWMIANGYARRWRSLVAFLLSSIAVIAIVDADELVGTIGLLLAVAVHAGARKVAESRGVPKVPRVGPDGRQADPVGTEGR